MFYFRLYRLISYFRLIWYKKDLNFNICNVPETKYKNFKLHLIKTELFNTTLCIMKKHW